MKVQLRVIINFKNPVAEEVEVKSNKCEVIKAAINKDNGYLLAKATGVVSEDTSELLKILTFPGRIKNRTSGHYEETIPYTGVTHIDIVSECKNLDTIRIAIIINSISTLVKYNEDMKPKRGHIKLKTYSVKEFLEYVGKGVNDGIKTS